MLGKFIKITFVIGNIFKLDIILIISISILRLPYFYIYLIALFLNCLTFSHYS